MDAFCGKKIAEVLKCVRGKKVSWKNPRTKLGSMILSFAEELVVIIKYIW